MHETDLNFFQFRQSESSLPLAQSIPNQQWHQDQQNSLHSHHLPGPQTDNYTKNKYNSETKNIILYIKDKLRQVCMQMK